ncbi:MAG: hypothetical protein WCL49_13125 [bacterium]|jgi:hypothetical protein
MMINKWRMAGLAAVLSVMAIGVWTGCESAGGTGGVSISPANPVLGSSSSNTTAVVFTASVSGQLALPLAWSVSNPTLGTIISASGSNATYKANEGRTGDNIVTVKDQYDNQGSAVVTQN